MGQLSGCATGTNLRVQTEPKRRFSQISADFCRNSHFLRKQSIREMLMLAENRRFSHETAENRRKPQKTIDLIRPLTRGPKLGAGWGPRKVSAEQGVHGHIGWRRWRLVHCLLHERRCKGLTSDCLLFLHLYASFLQKSPFVHNSVCSQFL